MTKPLPIQAHHNLTKPWLFRRAQVIEEATRLDNRWVNMVRIPSDEDQDDAERQLRVREYMELFRAEMDMVKRQGRKKELLRHSRISEKQTKLSLNKMSWETPQSITYSSS